MITEDKLFQIFGLDDSEIHSERERIVEELADTATDPEFPFIASMYFLETIEVLDFVAVYNDFMEKYPDTTQPADPEIFIKECIHDLVLWVNERRLSEPFYGFDVLEADIRYYVSKVRGEAKNSIAGLINYLIYFERGTVFSTMNSKARSQMYLFAVAILGIQM